MIWVHKYGIGKFGKRIIRTIHDSYESAEAARVVLGGTITAYNVKD